MDVFGLQRHYSRLEIGGGEAPLYRPNMDYRPLPTVDIVHDITKIPWPLNCNIYDIVYLSHVLEHIPVDIVPNILKEAGRILKPNAKIEIHVPDIQAICQIQDWQFAVKSIFGASQDNWAMHRSGFWKIGLQNLMQKLGYSNVKVTKGFYRYSNIHPTPELVCKAQKIVKPYLQICFASKDKR